MAVKMVAVSSTCDDKWQANNQKYENKIELSNFPFFICVASLHVRYFVFCPKNTGKTNNIVFMNKTVSKLINVQF